MKNIGKPCTGKPYARFDEGGQVNVTMIGLLRHRQTKGTATDRFDLRCGKPVFYSTYLLYLSTYLSVITIPP
jgi:hypothetical protein